MKISQNPNAFSGRYSFALLSRNRRISGLNTKSTSTLLSWCHEGYSKRATVPRRDCKFSGISQLQ